MDKIYSPPQKIKNKPCLPSKETIKTILAYSQAVTVIKFTTGKKVLVNLN